MESLHLKHEGRDKDSSDEDVVPSQKGVVDGFRNLINDPYQSQRLARWRKVNLQAYWRLLEARAEGDLNSR